MVRQITPNPDGFLQRLRTALGAYRGPLAPSRAPGPVRVHPLARRKRIDGIALTPEGFTPGWVQYPGTDTFALGFFLDDGRFLSVALADGHGHVRAPGQAGARSDPWFTLESDGTWQWDDGERLGLRRARNLTVRHGSAYGLDQDGSRLWLGSWLEHHGTYTLEQVRTPLARNARQGLPYRDAVTVAFFGMYLLPSMHGLLVGYGVSDLERRLAIQAPLSAIRSAVHDTARMQAHGFTVSGLEAYASRLMHEAGALADVPGLQSEHGVEPMHTVTVPNTGNRYLAWDRSLPFEAALASMTIEGNLNRIGQVSSWLDVNASYGQGPTEHDATEAMVGAIDRSLLANPALAAFGNALPPFAIDDWHAVNTLTELAHDTARHLAQGAPGEWAARQALSLLMRTMRVPYRYDVDFRMDLREGRAAISFTAASPALMPRSIYDDATATWQGLDERARTALSARYNLRIGIMLAALAFGVDERLEQVSIRLDSIGLEEAIAQQDRAIRTAMNETLSLFEHMPLRDYPMGGKSEPKDGDLHGGDLRLGAPDTADANGEHSIDEEFERLVGGMDIDSVRFDDEPPLAGEDADGTDAAMADDDPMAPLRGNPQLTPVATVTFTRRAFLNRLAEDGLEHPRHTYALFDAHMALDGDGTPQSLDDAFSLQDPAFTPRHALDEPESGNKPLPGTLAPLLGTTDTFGLAIQRESLLEHAVQAFHALAADTTIPTVDKAQRAMRLVDRIADPELTRLAPDVTAALIDGRDTPDPAFGDAQRIDDARTKARDLLFGGQVDQAVDSIETMLDGMDARYRSTGGVPRYFNSYADRVVYNRLFALRDETTVLIPDNLFYAHLEAADALAQIRGADEAIAHLNTLVAYAPSYPLVHIKLAAQLARKEDWDSVRAACLNALRVALDRTDAAWAYHRLAQAAWMRDEFDLAVACYLLADAIAPGLVPTLREELDEVASRARSQAITVPGDPMAAAKVLAHHDVPVWPNTEIAPIVMQAARATVDEGLFVPARTLGVAAARMRGEGIDPVQMQFLRSLNA